MKRRAPVLGLLATLVLLVGACGGDDALSDREYFAALEEVNAAAEARNDAISDPSPDDPESIAAFFDDLRTSFVETRADLAGLAAPPALAAVHDALVAAMDRTIDEIERIRDGDDGETIAGVRALFASDGIAEFNRVCARLHQLAADRDITFVFDDDCTDT